MGTPDMLDVTAGETPLFSQPAPAPAAEAAPAPAAEAAPAPAAEAAPAPVSEKIGKVRAKREDLFAKFRKKSGQASMGIDPELAAIAAEIAATYVEEGVIRFSDFASRVKADAADLWGQIRRYLHGAWTSSGTVNPNIDEVTRAEAAKILDDLDAAPTPVEEAAPQKEELPTDLVDEDSVPTPPPAGEPATPEERNAKLGFGQNKRLSVNQLLAQGKQNYLFETLLDDTQMAAALRSNSDAVRRAQGVVRRMPEYQDYLAEKAKTPQQREQENAPFVERVTQGIEALNNVVGASAEIAADGSVRIKTLPEAYKPLLSQNGFVFDATEQAFINRNYAKVLDFQQALRDALTGQTTTNQNRTPDGIYRARVRAEQESETNQSTLPAEAVATSLGARIKNLFMNSGMPDIVQAEQMHDVALMTKAQQEGKPMFLLASGTGTGKTFILAGFIAEMRRLGVQGRIVFVTQSKDLADQNKKDMAPYLESTGSLQQLLDNTPAEQRQEAVDSWLRRNPDAAKALQEAVNAAAEPNIEDFALEEAQDRFAQAGRLFQVVDGNIAFFRRVSGRLRPSGGVAIRGELGGIPAPAWDFLKPIVLDDEGQIIPLSERFNSPVEQDAPYADLMTVPEDNSVEFMSYSDIDNAEKFKPSESDILIFDESHKVRYDGNDVASKRALKAAEWIKKSKFTVFSSATPFESIQQMRFLWPTKVFDLLPGNRPYGDVDGNWYNFVAAAGGVVSLSRDGKPTSSEFKADDPNEEANMLFARDFFYKKGMMAQRVQRIPVEMTENDFLEVEGEAKWADLANKIVQVASSLKGLDRNTKGYITHLLKRVLEYSKINAASDLAMREAALGRQVAIFVETRSEKLRNLPELVAIWDAHKRTGEPLPADFTPRMSGAIDLFRGLIGMGVTSIDFPDIQTMFRERLGDNVVFYTGAETGKSGDNSLGRWTNKEVPVLVSTVGRGGTGLSLHDRSEDGSAPRTQIVLTLPWRATETDQVAGRVVRYGMTSKAKLRWLFANNILNEEKLAAKVGSRMRSMSTLVTGAPSESSERISNWQFDPLESVFSASKEAPVLPVSTDAASAEAVEEVQLEVSSQPAASAKPSDRVVGNVSMESMQAGLASLARLFPGIRNLVRIDTAANLLADPNISDAEKDKIRQGAQGLYYKGRVLIAQDNVRQTVFHKDQTVAASVVIFHELMHKGADIIKSAPQLRSLYARWESMLSENVSETELDNLVRQGYAEYSNWREDRDKKLRAQEEVFVRKLESLLARKGVGEFAQDPGLVRRFLDWMRDLLDTLFGLSPKESFPDAVLRDWGREFIRAANLSGYYRYIKDSNVAASVASFEGGIELPAGNGTPRTGLETLTLEQAEAFKEYSKQNDSNLKLSQILGFGEQGNVSQRESLAPLSAAAQDLIGFAEDESGFPIVSESATDNARRIALQLLDPATKFGEQYQRQFGPESAATAVLQLELVRYGQALLQKGDYSLLGVVKTNANSVVLGTYLTATAAGRVLRARGYYVSDVQQTIEEYNDLAKEALLNRLTKEGASRDEAESVVEAVEKAIREAELSQQQLLDLAKNLNSRPEAEAVNSAEDVLSRIERGLELFGQPDVAKVYGDLTTALLELAQEEQDAAEFRAASAAAPDVSASFFTDPRKAGREKPKTAEEAAERVRAAREKADALAKKLMGLLGKKKKPTTATAGEPRKTKKTESEAQLEDAEEDVNEATEAARRILEELDAFLKRKFQTKAPQKTIYDVLRKLVDDRIANAEDLGYAEFVARLNKELEDKDIDPKVVEDLVARSWTVYQRHPGKTAEGISAKFQRLLNGWAPYRKAIPQRTEALRDLVQQAVQNKDNLELGEFMDRLVPQLEALTIPTDLANRMAEDVFNEFGRRQEEKATNRFNAIRTALLNGARDLLIEKASVGDPSDALWRMDTLRSALEESGLSDEEIDNALPRFTQSDLDIIFGTTPPAQVTPQLLNARIERVRQRYEESLKRPKEEPANVVRQDNIRRLLRRQLRVPAGQEAFRAQAAMFGATREQADRLFELTERERSLYIAEEGRSPTLLSKLVGYIRSAPAAIRNSPENRKLAIEEFLEQNGFDKVQIRAAMPWISREFDKFIQEAKKKALEAEAKRIDDNLKRSEVRRTVTQTEKLRELINKDLQLIRDGMGDFEADPTQALAQKLGFTEFKKEDYRILSDLDLTITRALQDGRAHDMARGLKELYDFMGRRKAPKTFLQQLAVSYNNSALSGVGTLAINIVAPGGALAVRAALDVFKHLSRGNLKGASDVAKILTDSMTNIVREVEFSLVGGANLNAMQSMIGRATNLQPELRDNLKKYRDKKLSPQARLFAGFRVLMAYTDITRRLLGTTDHVWYTVMQNYFLKTQGLKELTDAGVPREKAMAMLFYRSQEVSAALQNELLTIANFESTINEASDEELMPKIREFLESPYADGSTEEQKIFEDDLKAAIRRTAVAFGKFPRANRKNLLAEIKLQKSAATLRANDKSKKELKADIVGLMDPTKQAEVQANLDAAEVKETEFEMGTHRGEESPMYDIANVLSTQIQKAGSAVLRDRPILGRMLLGYFGIPINLLNRSLWFTPYGLLRYAIAKNAMKTPEARQKFYTQSMNSQAQIRQRFVEASVGTAASIALVALQLLGEDDDEFLEITLGGPVNKAEYDAWYKMGNRRNSIQLNIGGKVFALNYGRGPLESLKIALILSGAVNDMRLNRKIGDDATQVSLSEYLAAVLSGWNQQASFFGAKSTIGATLSASPDASVVGTLLYKLNPVIPFSGLIASTEKFITGPNQFRGRQGAIFMNLPIARSLLTERAVNPLGDAVGTTLQSPFQQTLERLWYAGMPMTMTTPVSGEDARIYQFILDRGIAPGLPQRAALESKNGLMWDSDWQRYVEVRGRFLKTDLARNLARFQRMSDDDLTKAIAELSTRATKQAKRYFRYQ